ncbi:MAG: ABC transporter ATP-binding protein [Eubacteriales bacterium]|nr:ABC transporter ATP-binding protein [Clostridiales bacterium]MDY5835670.1 ABC transporter ATP-binding protein [Eubacteriales bacterium]
MQRIKRFASYYKPYKKIFWLDMFCAVIISLCGIAFPIIIRYLLNEVFVAAASPAAILQAVTLISLILLGLYFIQAICQYYVTSMGHIMGARMEYDMRREIFSHMEKLSFSYYDKHSTGAMSSRILADLFDITELAHHGPENILISLVKLLGAFIFLFTVNWQVTLILIGVTVFMFLFSWQMNKQMRKTFMENRKTVAGINSVAQDSLSGIRTVASYNNEDLELERFDKNNQNFLDSKTQNYLVMGRYHSINGFLQGLMYIAVILAGGIAVARGKMLASDIVIYVLYINLFLDPIRTLINFTEQFQKGMTGFERFCEIIDTEPEVQDRPHAIEAGRLQGNIVFDNVSFAYDDAEEHVLENINLEIPALKTIALVGPSGGGKTTFCSLIPRYYNVSQGAITIDGVDVRDYTLKSLRDNVAVVQQDVYIFNMSVRDNIAYGRPGASMEEIIAAAKQANIHDFIMSLPEGYDTQCGEQGVRFSGGQKQRISIARVFLKNPPILVLDEATSALDNQSEFLVQQALDQLSTDRTTFVIAHRLSTIRNADEILVLTDQGIVERGTHADLYAQGGLYKELYDLQFQQPSASA